MNRNFDSSAPLPFHYKIFIAATGGINSRESSPASPILFYLSTYSILPFLALLYPLVPPSLLPAGFCGGLVGSPFDAINVRMQYDMKIPPELRRK